MLKIQELQEKGERKERKRDTNSASQSKLSEKFIFEENKLNLFQNFKSFSFFWSLIMSFMEIYVIFSAFYWIGSDGYPEEISKVIEILIEIFFIIDLFVKIFFQFLQKDYEEGSQQHDYNQFLEGKTFYFMTTLQRNKIVYSISSILTAVPLVIILNKYGVMEKIEKNNLKYLLIIKLLRYFNIQMFLKKVQFILKYTNLQFVINFKLIYNLVIFFLFIHICGCAFLFVNKFHSIHNSFMATHELEEAHGYVKYVVGLEGAVDAITGCSFGFVVPGNNVEIVLTIIYIVVGGAFCAIIFAGFEHCMHLTRHEFLERRMVYEQAQQFCIERNINPAIRKKIRAYFTEFKQGYEERQNYELIKILPFSLQTEISLYLNSDLLKKVHLFNFGSPHFILATARYFYPKISMQYDMVIRAGEIAEEFFIIKQGRVEVLAYDGKTVIGILEKGSYFGEIGLLGLNNGKRTASIRAMENSIFLCLNKQKFYQVLQLFPDFKAYLQRIAEQRFQTTDHYEVVDTMLPYVPYDEVGEADPRKKNDAKLYFKIFLEEEQARLEQDRLKKLKEKQNQMEDSNSDEDNEFEEQRSFNQITKLFNDDLSQIIDKFDLMASELIIPNYHLAYYVWMGIILTAIFYNTFYIPFSISFSYDFQGIYILIDIIAIVIYMFDIYIRSKTFTFDPVTKKPIKSQNKTDTNYINQYLFLDFIAAVPLDYIFMIFSDSITVARWLRVLRLLKYIRFKLYYHEHLSDQEQRFKYSLLAVMCVIFVISNHISACIMYSIAKDQYYSHLGQPHAENMGTFMNEKIIEEMRPFMKMNKFNLYIYFLYWAVTCSSSGAFGDILGVAEIEKIFQLIVCIYFRIFVVFVFSEISHVSQTYKSPLAKHLEEVDILNIWMSHNKMPNNIKQRVHNFMNYRWQKLKGINDDQILETLPQSVQQEVLFTMMQNIANMVISPEEDANNNTGAIFLMLKKLKKKLIPAGEIVFKEDEIATEMYFIIEGKAVVLKEQKGTDKPLIISYLKKDNFFGEMGILEKKPTKRGATIKAETDLYLACLNLQDFINICEYYPNFQTNLRKLAKQRQEKMEKKQKLQQQLIIQKQMKLQQIGLVEEQGNDEIIIINNNDKNNNNNGAQVKSKPRLNNFLKNGKYNANKNKFWILNSAVQNQKLNYFQKIKKEEKIQTLKKKILIKHLIRKKENDGPASLMFSSTNILLGKQLNLSQDGINNNNKQQAQSEIKTGNLKPSFFKNMIQAFNVEDEKKNDAPQNQILKVEANEQKKKTFQSFEAEKSNAEIVQNFKQDNHNFEPIMSPVSNENQPLKNNFFNDSSKIQKKQKKGISNSNQAIDIDIEGWAEGDDDDNNKSINFDGILTNIKKEFGSNQRQKQSKQDNNSNNIQNDLQQSEKSQQLKLGKEIDVSIIQKNAAENNSNSKVPNFLPDYLEDDDFVSFKNILQPSDEQQGEMENELGDQIVQNNKDNEQENDQEEQQKELEQFEDQYEYKEVELNDQNKILYEQMYKNYVNYEEHIMSHNKFDQNIIISKLDCDLSKVSSVSNKDEENPKNGENGVQQKEKAENDQKKSFQYRTKYILKRIWQFLKLHVFQIQKNSLLIFIILFYYYMIIPLHLAFEEINFYSDTSLLVVEILFTLILIAYAFSELLKDFDILLKSQDTRLYQEENFSKDPDYDNKLKKLYLYFVYNIIVAIPFCLIFDACGIGHTRTNFFLILLQLIRLTNFDAFFSILLKIGLKNMILEQITRIILSYFIMAHIIACFFIVIGNLSHDFNESWFAMLPAPQNNFPDNRREQLIISQGSKYLSALYWAYVATSHQGVGDVNGVNIKEKIYQTFVMLFSTFTTVYFFGNLAGMIKDIGPILKQEFDRKYNIVIETIKIVKLDNFTEKIDKYFNFIWRDQFGIDENILLNKLPNIIKVDILSHQYKGAINQSLFFKINAWKTDSKLSTSILRFMKIEIFLPDDVIINAGDILEEVYILLEGRAVAYTFEMKKRTIYKPGDYFGQIGEKNERYPSYIRAEKFCKLGVIPIDKYQCLGESFPDWKQKIQRHSAQERQELLKDLKISSFEKPDQQFQQEQPREQNESIDLVKKTESLKKEKTIEIQDQFLDEVNKDTINYQITDNTIQQFKKYIPWIINSDDELIENKQISSYKKQESVNRSSNFLQQKINNKLYIKNKNENNLSHQEEASEKQPVIIQNFSDLIEILDPLYKNISIFIHPYGQVRFFFDLVHLLFVLYIIFILPIIVSFNISPNAPLIVLESLCHIEVFLQIILELRTPFYQYGVLVTNPRQIFEFYRDSGKLQNDILSIFPINIIIWYFNINEYYDDSIMHLLFYLFTAVIRLFRLVQINYVFNLLSKIESRYRSLQKKINVIKSILILLLVWHFVACIWFWFNIHFENGIEDSWINKNNLQNQSFSIQYIYSMFWFISYANMSGYKTMKVYNDFERAILIICIYIGDALIAFGFGMMANQTKLLSDNLIETFLNMKNINHLIHNNKIEGPLKKRIEQFYQFLIESNNQSHSILENIKEYIPQSLYKEIVYQNAKDSLNKFQILQEMENPIIMRKIAQVLEPQIFLKEDYIIFKNDIGDEMYFIVSGGAIILNSNEEPTNIKLNQGQYFGEMALLAEDAKRMCSIMAGKLCQLFILKKPNLIQIFKNFPILEEKFKIVGEQRKKQFQAKDKQMANNVNSKQANSKDGQVENSNSQNSQEASHDYINSDIIQESIIDQKQQTHDPNKDIQNSDQKESNVKNKQNIQANENIANKQLQIVQEKKDILPNINNLLAKNQFNVKKIVYLCNNVKDDKEENNDLNPNDHSIEDIILDDEFKDMNQKKQSRRAKDHNIPVQRRLSRISLDKNLRLAKYSLISLHWGMNIHYEKQHQQFLQENDEEK